MDLKKERHPHACTTKLVKRDLPGNSSALFLVGFIEHTLWELPQTWHEVRADRHHVENRHM